ncbi:hypothetical protein LTR53_001770 [Teratosphaeriaceae sp. CCFEE 6253]|nr:hypothetical protein LTR53_001770 [Teratosphaeriaceae sp. CCFEE 6253]
MATTSTRQRHDDYWKLDVSQGSIKDVRAMLESRHYHVGSIRDGERLEKCYRRVQLGLLSYHMRSNDELRALVAGRKLDVSGYIDKYRQGQRFDLLRILDEADLAPSFHRFLELPPELRNQIYGYYYGACRKKVLAPSQPPLTLTCSLIRRETLPMFYATFVFKVQLYRGVYHAGRHEKLNMCDRQLLFWHSTLPEHIAAIKSLIVTVHLRGKTTDVDPASGFLPRDLDLARLPLSKEDWIAYWLTRRSRKLTVGNIDKYISVVSGVGVIFLAMSWSGGGELTKRDVFALRRAYERAYN